jgi:hypothetical protein
MYSDEVMDVEDDEQLYRGLVLSVQELAQQHGVLAHFTVGHADGRDNNCSILSAFAAAGHPISPEEAREYRLLLNKHFGIPVNGPIDLAIEANANAVHALLRVMTGQDYQLVAIRPNGRGAFALAHLAGSAGPLIFLFYASGHFSPARRR